MTVEFRVLGPLEAWRDGRAVDVRGTKRRALLALLVLHANEVVRRDRLIEELWGERPPSTATASLHNQVSRLRRDLGAETVVTRPSGYVLRVEPQAVDLHRFQALVSEAQPLPARERGEKLRAALSLWRGSPLTDLGAEEGLDREIERLEELRANAIEQRIEADLQLGRDGELVPELEDLVAQYPLRERLRAQLILALYRAGRQAEALETYRETRRVLVEELGIEPGPELKELERAILRQDPALSRTAPAGEPEVPAPPQHGRGRRRVLAAGAVLVLLGGVGAAAAVLVARGGTADPAARAASARASASSSGAAVTAGATAAATSGGDGRATGSRATASTSTGGRPPSTGRAGAGSTTTASTHVRPSTGRNGGGAGGRRGGAPAARLVTETTSTSTRPGGRPKPKPKPKPKPAAGAPVFLLADGFESPALDTALWDRGEAGSGVTFTETGRLEVSVAADAAPGGQYQLLEGQYQTNCGLTGNFDARVDFQTLTWPQRNGISIVLGADFPGDFVVASRASLDWGEGYWSNFGSWPRISAGDASGGLRLRRTSGSITSYYRRGGRWVKLESRTTPRAPAHIVLQLASYGPTPYSGPVAAAFDDFRATSQSVACPPGVPLPRRVRK